MVLALSPASLPMFRKLTPSGVPLGGEGFCVAFCQPPPNPSAGPIAVSKFSSDTTSADLLNDLRNFRRGKDNRAATLLLVPRKACYTPPASNRVSGLVSQALT